MKGMDALRLALKDHRDTKSAFLESARQQAVALANEIGQGMELIEGYAVAAAKDGLTLLKDKKPALEWSYDEAMKFVADVEANILDRFADIFRSMADGVRKKATVLGPAPKPAPRPEPKPAPPTGKPEAKVQAEYFCVECRQRFPLSRFPTTPESCPSCMVPNCVVKQPMMPTA